MRMLAFLILPLLACKPTVEAKPPVADVSCDTEEEQQIIQLMCGLLIQNWATERNWVYIGESKFVDMDTMIVEDMEYMMDSCAWGLDQEQMRINSIIQHIEANQ